MVIAGTGLIFLVLALLCAGVLGGAKLEDRYGSRFGYIGDSTPSPPGFYLIGWCIMSFLFVGGVAMVRLG